VSPSFRLSEWLRALWPAPVAVDARERLRASVGATLGILIAGVLCRGYGSSIGTTAWLVAPIGASAVLVFALPASPLAQPWSVIGGNTLSALMGILAVRLLAPSPWTAPVAVGAAIAVMFATRCLHPPGGAAALLMTLNGVSDFRYALFPVLANCVLLAAAGVAYNNATRRSYPHRAPSPAKPTAELVEADLKAAIARYNQVLDVSVDDLQALLEDTRLRGYQRQLAGTRCADIMSRAPVTVRGETPRTEARALFRQHRIKALPVVDDAGQVIGIVTPADFLKTPDDAGVVADVMTRQVRVSTAQTHLADLVPLFGSTGHHHLPIVDGDGKLVGIVTQSDVVAALSRGAR
jgi:CBS domain-containing membrane protein